MAQWLLCLGVAEVAEASDTMQGSFGAEVGDVCGQNYFGNSTESSWVGERLECGEKGLGGSRDSGCFGALLQPIGSAVLSTEAAEMRVNKWAKCQ